jgi:hypothetical protein
MKKFALWQIKFAITQGLVSKKDVETLLKQMEKRDVEAYPIRIETEYLRQVSDNNIDNTFEATDGTETITDTKGIFDWTDGDFKNCGLNNPSKPTERTNLVPCQLVKNGMFSNIYKSLKTNAPPVSLDYACVAQSQIVSYVKKNKEKIIKGGCSRFFLLKKDESILCKDDPTNENLFVASVNVHSDGYLSVYVRPFSRDSGWRVAYGHLFLFPQLTA